MAAIYIHVLTVICMGSVAYCQTSWIHKDIQVSYAVGQISKFYWEYSSPNSFSAIRWFFTPTGVSPGPGVIMAIDDGQANPTIVNPKYADRLTWNSSYPATMLLDVVDDTYVAGVYSVDVTLKLIVLLDSIGTTKGYTEFVENDVKSGTAITISGKSYKDGDTFDRAAISGVDMAVTVTITGSIQADIFVEAVGANSAPPFVTVLTCPLTVPQADVGKVMSIKATIMFGSSQAVVEVKHAGPKSCCERPECIGPIIFCVLLIVIVIIVVIVLAACVGPPLDVTAVPGSILVAWAKPKKLCIITGYKVRYSVNPKLPHDWAVHKLGKELEAKLHDVLPTTNYTIVVQACNGLKDGKLSETTHVCTLGEVSGTYPTDVKARCERPYTAVVNWRQPEKCRDIRGYQIRYTLNPNLSLKDWNVEDVRETHNTSAVIGKLEPLRGNSTYTIVVQTKTSDRNGPPSVATTVRIEAVPCSFPSDVEVSQDRPHEVTVQWKAPTGAGEIKYYEVSYRACMGLPLGKWKTTKVIKSEQVTITGLLEDTEYYVFVVAMMIGMDSPSAPSDLKRICLKPDGKARSSSGSSRGITTPTTIVIDPRHDSAITRKAVLPQIASPKGSRLKTDTLDVMDGIPTQQAGTPRKLPPLLPPVNRVGPDDDLYDPSQNNMERRRKRKKKKVPTATLR